MWCDLCSLEQYFCCVQQCAGCFLKLSSIQFGKSVCQMHILCSATFVYFFFGFICSVLRCNVTSLRGL